jgi:hypothetical protein
MDMKTKTSILLGTMQKIGSGQLKAEDWQAFADAQNDGYRTGPEIGQKIVDFALPDQHGRTWPMRELMGSNGLLLVFTRSADW